ncbi:protocadherin-like wing polarity protein stan [Mytilus californianus]|uniref:protocadherin-like wing polarity protein stan n=1 Tax=Mytilus californianus TaxID=6549 RepID=UPI0022468B01|nr:protocadherin-like wing polarity protein stan [Mytilus californianus]
MIQATDIDGKGNNSKITYSIELPWKANFSIGNGGKITVIGALDRESIDDTEGHIKFVVIATDLGLPSLTGTTEVTVEVTDINDNCPYINTQDLRSTYLFKELEIPSNFHHIQVEDMDKTDVNRKMSYSFIGSHTGFTIDQNSGNLSATEALAMEHTINGQIKLTITVSNNPTCLKNIRATQTVVINVQMFIINQLTGEITVSATTGLDYDNDVHSYMLQVLATDNGSPKLTGTAVVEVDVHNKNDNSPSFSNKTYTFKVMEDAPVLTMVGIIQASDKDGDDLKYSIASNTPGIAYYDEFSLESDTGLLTLKSSLIDKTKITFTVQAKDSNKTGTATVIVNVIDVNNHPPMFKQKVYYRDVAENDDNFTVTTVQATDKDNSPGNKNISYSIGSPWNTNFTVDSKTGKVKVKGHLDRELVDDSGLITFVVMATDQGNPPLTGAAEVTVKVTDKNDNCPYYIDKEVTYLFKEYDQPVFHNFMLAYF